MPEIYPLLHYNGNQLPITATTVLFRVAIVVEIGKSTIPEPRVLRLPHLLYLGIFCQRRFSVTATTVTAAAVATAAAAFTCGPNCAHSAEAAATGLS